MKYSFAVLLLRMADQSGTPFDPDYAWRFFTKVGKGTRNLVDYYLDMSHGQVDLGDSEVFGWLDVPHTADELASYEQSEKDIEIKRLSVANSTLPDKVKLTPERIEKEASFAAQKKRRAKLKEWAHEAAASIEHFCSFYSFVAVFSAPIDYYGNTEGVVVNYNPDDEELLSIDLTGVAHEVGHALGLKHSGREGSDRKYGDGWDIMSAYSVFYNHTGSRNEDPSRPYRTYGPGLNAVNMQIRGWLDLSRVYQFPAGDDSQVTLRPLHRRDLPGYLAAQLGSLWIEFRMDELWDSAIPRPAVLLHRRSVDDNGAPCSMLIPANRTYDAWLSGSRARHDLGDGETFEIGNALDLDRDFMRLQVAIDAEAREATVFVSHRAAKQLEPALPFGSVTSGGGGLIWTPSRGWVRVPPRSPLYSLLEQIAEIEQLQSLTAAPAQQPVIDALTTERLGLLRDQLDRMVAGRQARWTPALPLQARGEEG